MKVLFVYPNIYKSIHENLALESLSAILKQNEIEVFLWDNTFEEIDILKYKVKHIDPDFICFTALSPDFNYAIELAGIIKSISNIPIIIGGPHVTFLPHEAIYQNCFDVVIRGEGDEVLLEYLLTENKYTLGTWVKYGSTVYTNGLAPLPDVKKLPWVDHGLFQKHFKRQVTWSSLEKSNYGIFMTARGCPFHCSYCYSKGMQNLYKGQSYTRYRDIDDVIAEVKHTVETYNIKSLYFIDETLTTNKQRILELCIKYKKEIGLPWHCETRPNTVDQEVFDAMADSGCTVVMMGIESGSSRVRNLILNRKMSRGIIINAFKMAKKAGIKTSAFNICGSPTETKEEIRETIKLNQECQVDMGKMTIFTAFPGSELWNYCKQRGYYLRSNYPTNYYIDSNLQHDTLTLKELMKLRKEFINSIGGYTGSQNKNNGEY